MFNVLLRKRILIHFLCHIIFLSYILSIHLTMKDGQPLLTNSTDNFHHEKVAPFSYRTITNHLISTICTTFLTIMSAAFKFYGHRKQITARSFLSIVFSVTGAIVEKWFSCEKRSTNIPTSTQPGS